MQNFYFYIFYFLFLFLFLFWAGPASPARSLAQAWAPAGAKPTGGTRGVSQDSPRVHVLCEGN
jgi:hypothetical protein